MTSTAEWIEAMYRGDLRLANGVTVHPPWDLGRPQPAVVRLVESGQVRGRVLDAGCGTGEHVAYLVENDHRVVGVDISATAIAIARRKLRHRGVAADLVVADAVMLDGYPDTFDTVLDVGLFHLLTPQQRGAYARTLHRACRRGAVLHVLSFVGYAGPDELRDALGAAWEMAEAAPSRIVGRVADPRLAQQWYQVAARPDGIVELPAWLMSARRIGDAPDRTGSGGNAPCP